MAALEKIRKRAAILTIVIGAGLLAFILEEAVRASGAFRTDTLAAKVGDEKIEIKEFQDDPRLKQQAQDPEQKTDQAVLQQNVLQQMIEEKLIEQECEDANIVVTGAEVTEIITKSPSQTIIQMCQAVGLENPADLLKLLKNPGKIDPNDEQFRALRAQYESEVQNIEKQLKKHKLGLVVAGSMQANAIDIQITKNEGIMYDITYAKVDYSTVDDKFVKVTNQDLQNAYNKYKELFKIDEENRLVQYIKVDIDPSAQDKAQAAQKINTILADLQNNEGISGIRSNSDVVIDSMVTTQDDKQLFRFDNQAFKQENRIQVITDLLANPEGCQRKDPTGRDRNTFLYKVMRTYQSIDSIGLDLVRVNGNKQRQDSVLALLNGNVSLDSIKSVPDVEVNAFNPQQQKMRGFSLTDSIRSKIKAANDNFFIIDANDNGAVIARVASKIPERTFYVIARAKYVDYPSEGTVDALTALLQKYINTNKTLAAFKKNAKSRGYNYEVVAEMINPETAQLGAQGSQFGMMPGISESRKAVKWAFESKPGDISQIFSTDTELLVVAVDKVYNDYLPIDNPDVKKFLTEMVKNEKKAEYLMNQYKFKNNVPRTLEECASLMKAQIDSATVSMASPQLDGRVAGVVAALGEKGKGQVKVIAGRNALYVIQIIGRKETERTLKDSEYAQQFVQQHMPVQQMFSGILRGSRKVKNNLVKFM